MISRRIPKSIPSIKVRVSSISVLGVCLLLCVAAAAQSVTQDRWTRIESLAGNFSIELPLNGMFSLKGEKSITIWNYDDGLMVNVQLAQSVDADKSIKADSKNRVDRNSAALYSIGDFTVEKIDLDPYLAYKTGVRFYIGDRQNYYTVIVRARDERKAVLERIVYSIKLAGKALVVSANASTTSVPQISAADLKTSDTVANALNRSIDQDLKLTSEDKGSIITPEDRKFSRELAVLDMPRAEEPMSPEQRYASQMLTVKLAVTFGSNGQIRSVKLMPEPTDLMYKPADFMNYSAFRAARQIKFLPAEIDGKPFDVTREVDYRFRYGQAYPPLVVTK